VFELAVGVGKVLITTVVVAVALQPLAFVTVTVYVPAAAVVTLLMLGFCRLELNEFGPDHAYDVPPDEIKFNVLPTQTGVFELAVGVGKVLITTVVVAVVLHPLAFVTVTVYVPAADVVTLVIPGFWLVELNEFGPAHE
jgi:hypothetical protein